MNIGITMRVTNAANYDEPRDAIAKDWYAYLEKIFPDYNWLLLPNIEDKIVHYVERWQIDGFVFSGGEDIGSCTTRDNTELALFKYAQEQGLPILGVCRGFQILYTFLGGEIPTTGRIFFQNSPRHPT